MVAQQFERWVRAFFSIFLAHRHVVRGASPSRSIILRVITLSAVFTFALAFERCIPVNTSAPSPGYYPPERMAPPAPPAPRRFCDQFGRGQTRPNHTVTCEDFSSVAEGTLPAGWLGGEGLGVRGRPGQGVLTPFERREALRVSIPNLRATASYQFDWALRLGLGNTQPQQHTFYRFFVGPVTVTFRTTWASGWPATLIMNQSEVQDELPDFGGQTVHFSLRRDGPIHQFFLNGRQMLVARYAPGELVDGISFEVEGVSSFALLGLRLDAETPPVATLTATTTPAATPAPQTTAAPAPRIHSIAMSGSVCAQMFNQTVRCSDTQGTALLLLFGSENTARIVGRDRTICATDTSNHHRCWGDLSGWNGMQGGVEGNGPHQLQAVGGVLIPPADGVNGLGAVPLVLSQNEVRTTNVVGVTDGVGERVPFPGPVSQVEQGAHTACALLQTQAVYCRAAGPAIPVMGAENAREVHVGRFHACAILSDNQVRCWGICRHGEAEGSGTPSCRVLEGGRRHAHLRSFPVALSSGAWRLAVSEGAACATLADSTVTCWRLNARGEASRPQTIENVTNVQNLVASDTDACAVQDGERVICWSPQHPTTPRRVLTF